MATPTSQPDLSERIVLNVGGTRFETYVSTLVTYPETLLGAMFASRNSGLLRTDSNNEFFFDRYVEGYRQLLLSKRK